MILEELWQALRTRYPWPDRKPIERPTLHGWTTHEQKMARLCRSPELVVEVGTWFGKSALAALSTWPDARLICIDHFEGSVEHQPGQAHHHQELPRLREHCLSNLWPRRERVCVIPKASQFVFQELRELLSGPGQRPLVDLVYIDASHLFPDVYGDVLDAASLDPGVICGDDYMAENGVWYAVHAAVHALEPRELHTEGRFWWLI